MPVGGVEWDEKLEAIHEWVVEGSSLTEEQVVWGQQDAPRPAAPAILMRISNIGEAGPSWTDTEENPHTFDDLTITSVNAGADTLTSVAHGRLTGDGPVHINSTLTLPDGLVADTDYWIVKTSNDVFQFAASFQDAMAVSPVVVGIGPGTGSGTITVSDTSDTRRAGEEILNVARVMLRATVELRCHANPVIGAEMAVAILQRLRLRREWESQREILQEVNVSATRVGPVIAVNGTRDDFLYEPRAHLLVYMEFPAEESEVLGIIERVILTNETRDPDFEFVVDAA